MCACMHACMRARTHARLFDHNNINNTNNNNTYKTMHNNTYNNKKTTTNNNSKHNISQESNNKTKEVRPFSLPDKKYLISYSTSYSINTVV